MMTWWCILCGAFDDDILIFILRYYSIFDTFIPILIFIHSIPYCCCIPTRHCWWKLFCCCGIAIIIAHYLRLIALFWQIHCCWWSPIISEFCKCYLLLTCLMILTVSNYSITTMTYYWWCIPFIIDDVILLMMPLSDERIKCILFTRHCSNDTIVNARDEMKYVTVIFCHSSVSALYSYSIVSILNVFSVFFFFFFFFFE